MRSVTSLVSLSAYLLASSVTAANTPLTVNGKKFYAQGIIARNVVIVGGGSSGCHIAVRLNIPLAPISFSQSTNFDYDLRTGKLVNRTYNPAQEGFAAGFAGYSAQLAKYP
ncbi:hypothetical protein GGP41_001441 [Bipolaris sorokiniana]|uniref:Glucose-methanol-choline oxidoreductase N-terminal domain-containing protein n=1 Tax=Cochliobolus sativus TaxID=45130 RepID=A0A8H5Z7V4_COCSA|nr:hypothetical protein GGP41_001441 [Bipolaris sorokiniana]